MRSITALSANKTVSASLRGLALVTACLVFAACGGTGDDAAPDAASDDAEHAEHADAGATVEGIAIDDVWSRATPGPVAAVFMQLTNGGAEADRLVSASTDASEFAEIHRSSMVDDRMRMEPLPDGIEVPAGETLTFEPGGLHIMLMKLNGALETDATFQVTLVFEKAGEQTIDVAVRAADADGHGGH